VVFYQKSAMARCCALPDLLGILRACDDAMLAPRMAETLAEAGRNAWNPV
jgi:hypothetical protein